MHRFLLTTSFIAFSSAVSAETFSLTSEIAGATVYPSGATIERSVMFDIPAGSHRLLIGDVPQGFDPASLRIKGGEGLIVGAMNIRTDRLPPDERENAARTEIEAKIETQEDLIRARNNDRTAVGLELDAARARIAYLEALGEGQENGAEAPDASEIQNLLSVIGDETLKALQDAHVAKLRIDVIARNIIELEEDLAKLHEELRAVALPFADRVVVSLDVTAETDISGLLQIEYLTENAAWAPVYDVRLDTTAESLAVTRQAMLSQHTGESWDDVSVILSTARPNLRLDPGSLYPQLAYLYENVELQRNMVVTTDMMLSAVEMEAPEAKMVGDMATFAAVTTSFQGLTAVYNLPNPVTLEGDGEESLFTIDTTDMAAELIAQATPLLDESVYLVADITNTSAAPFLPGQASFYRDGAFVGGASFPMIAAGEEADISFGAIDGLSTRRIVEFRESGESGLLTTSNDREERYFLTVKNVTNRAWDIRLLDRAPYSEEEDLEINVTARPSVTESDYDGKRGINMWALSLPSGEEKTVSFVYTIGWPEGKELGLR